MSKCLQPCFNCYHCKQYVEYIDADSGHDVEYYRAVVCKHTIMGKDAVAYPLSNATKMRRPCEYYLPMGPMHGYHKELKAIAREDAFAGLEWYKIPYKEKKYRRRRRGVLV